jgi:exopolyphosphatase/guanosine-5'-triphosphate,3'-diphosphate pyrophosphatase
VRVAAIDCGTNSLRILIAEAPEVPGGPMVDVMRDMRIVRLGQGVDRTGRLAPEAIERTRVALAEYVAAMSALGVDRVRMVATSASRDATNADEFHDMVVSTLGLAPEVITGDEEARLSFLGAVHDLPAGTTAPYLVVDIGGGSTEFVVGDGAATGVQAASSVDIGCVRLTERHFHDDPPSAAQVAAARHDIEEAAGRAIEAVRGRDATTVVGLAGSVTTVVAVVLGLDAYRPDRIHHARTSMADVARVSDEFLSMSSAERLALPVMHPGRADVIAAGALILRVVLELAGADSVVASEHDILDAIARDLAPVG